MPDLLFLTNLGLGALFLMLLGLLVAFLVVQIIQTSRLRKKSRHDYRTARGTQHKRQLRSSLSNLEREIRLLRSGIEKTKKQLANLEQQRASELRFTLCRYLVNDRLTEVRGIGPELSKRIVRSCFRSGLSDLRQAQYVSGVGPTRQQAINRWIQRYESALPRLLGEGFPGKASVGEKYEKQERELKYKLGAARKALEKRIALSRTGQTAYKKLSAVRLHHFDRALSGKSSDSTVPEWYFEGVYPAWESAPEWFETLLENYGG